MAETDPTRDMTDMEQIEQFDDEEKSSEAGFKRDRQQEATGLSPVSDKQEKPAKATHAATCAARRHTLTLTPTPGEGTDRV